VARPASCGGGSPLLAPKPLPANLPEGRAPTPVADAAPVTLPDAEAGGSEVGPRAAGDPEAARTEPEPVPTAAATE
jgi:hypothetical protein